MGEGLEVKSRGTVFENLFETTLGAISECLMLTLQDISLNHKQGLNISG